MKIIKASELTPAQKESVCSLWNREFPVQLATSPEQFEEYLRFSSAHNHFLVMDDASGIIGWAFTFNREGERWFSIIVHNLFQRSGLGRMLLNVIKEKEARLSGWVIDHPHDRKSDGTAYESPLKFYLKNGFTLCRDVRYEDEKISAVKIEWSKN